MTTEQQIEPVTQADALLREIFLHGHVEGWTGNQNRRDAQHVDAEKGWLLYVSNGALEKTKARHNTTPAPSQHSELTDIENLLIYHETGGHEGDGSDHAMRKARAAFDSLRQPPSDAMHLQMGNLCHENGPVVIDWMGEQLGWRPLDYGTWTAFTQGKPDAFDKWADGL